MKKRIILSAIILTISAIFLFSKDTTMYNVKKLTADVKSNEARWHTVTLVPASTNNYLSKITSAKVSVGQKVNGYEVTAVSGTTIKVKAWGALYEDFILPKAADLWNGAIKSDYVIWAGTGSGQKTEGYPVMLPQTNATSYYYFNTTDSVSGNSDGSGVESYIWKFTLKYDSNGGYGTSTDQTYTTNNKYEKSHYFTISTKIPTRYGYTFLGWSKEKNAISPSYYPNDSYLMSNPTSKYDGGSYEEILYAIWEEEPTYTVTYTDGVSGESVFPDQGYEGLKEGDDTPAFIGTPMREGYDFIGWMLNTNKTIHTTVNSVIAEADADEKNEIVYVAQWEKNPNYTMNNLSVTKTANNTTPQVGQEFKYTIIIGNSNKFGVIVDITDIISKLLTYVNSSDNGFKKDDVVTWENITIPGNGSKEVTLFVKANQATTIGNTATIHLNNLTKSSNTEIIITEKPTYTVIYKDEFNSFSSQATYALQEGTTTPKFKEEPGKTQILEDGAIVPIRDGYRFIGWSKRINKVVSAEDANENYEIIYVANWQKMDTSPNEDINPPQIINKDNSNKIDNPLTEDKILKYITSGIISLLLIIMIILKNKKSIKDIFRINKNSFF